MGLVDYILIGVVVLILGLIVGFIYRSKKKGQKCIGCPDSGSCSSGCNGGCSGCGCGCGGQK